MADIRELEDSVVPIWEACCNSTIPDSKLSITNMSSVLSLYNVAHAPARKAAADVIDVDLDDEVEEVPSPPADLEVNQAASSPNESDVEEVSPPPKRRRVRNSPKKVALLDSEIDKSNDDGSYPPSSPSTGNPEVDYRIVDPIIASELDVFMPLQGVSSPILAGVIYSFIPFSIEPVALPLEIPPSPAGVTSTKVIEASVPGTTSNKSPMSKARGAKPRAASVAKSIPKVKGSNARRSTSGTAMPAPEAVGQIDAGGIGSKRVRR